MSTAKKKSASPVTGAIDVAAEQFVTAADMVKGGIDAALDASAEQARAACAFEGVEFAGREHVDTALKAGEAYFAGIKGLNDLWFQSAKEAVRFNADAVKTLSGCKTPEALSEAQMKLMTGGVEAAMTNANAFSQAATKAVGDVTGQMGVPLSNPFTDAMTAPFAQFWNKTAA